MVLHDLPKRDASWSKPRRALLVVNHPEHFSLLLLDTSVRPPAYAHLCSSGLALPERFQAELTARGATECTPLDVARQCRDDECGFFVLAYAEAVKAACGPDVCFADAMGRGALSEYMPTLNERAIAIRRQELRRVAAEARR